MKRPLNTFLTFLGLALLMVLCPSPIRALAAESVTAPPPIAQKLVREGEFAVKLEFALGVGVTEDEAEAETRLGELGIVPRNGWIADYPVTPDIVGELQEAVSSAAETNKLQFGREEALARLDGVIKEFDLAVRPYENGAATTAASGETSQLVTEINNYYTTQGPPVVTYYTPPPDWYYLYSWVPYPFWYSSFWFAGFFVLNDFHRPHFVHNRVYFVSNHFNDLRRHRVFRVDPVTRFNGRTFSGIGVPHRRDFIGTGVDRSERRIFNAPRAVAAPGMRPMAGMRNYLPSRGVERTYVPAPRSSGRSDRTLSTPNRSVSPAPRASGNIPRGGGNFSPGRGASSGGGGRSGQRR